MGQASAQGMHPVHGEGNEAGGIRIPPCGLGGRKMAANIAISNSAENSIGQRVQGDIGITVSG